MSAPRQMTAQTLNAIKGWGANMHAVDFNAKLDPTITKRTKPGTVARINSSGNYALGVGALFAMPIFLFNASDDPDVSNDGGDPATDKGAFVPVAPTGQMMGLVANGALELHSTTYDTGEDYPPNTQLTAPTGTDPDAGHGVLTVGEYPDDTICGCVSRGVVDNGYGYNGVAFWPLFLPAHTH